MRAPEFFPDNGDLRVGLLEFCAKALTADSPGTSIRQYCPGQGNGVKNPVWRIAALAIQVRTLHTTSTASVRSAPR